MINAIIILYYDYWRKSNLKYLKIDANHSEPDTVGKRASRYTIIDDVLFKKASTYPFLNSQVRKKPMTHRAKFMKESVVTT